jgi:hypothetical protein
MDTNERLAHLGFTLLEVEMSNRGLSDQRLLEEAKSALRQKDIDRAKPLLAEFSERSVANAKGKVANDEV